MTAIVVVPMYKRNINCVVCILIGYKNKSLYFIREIRDIGGHLKKMISNKIFYVA